jgi:hypothetical protein
MPGQRLSGCKRGNGDGEAIDGFARKSFCECNVCASSRWLRMKITRGQLAPSQESVVRELIRHLGGEA